MISEAPVSGGAMPFPDPPKGDPGAIAGCASTLRRAADDVEHADTGLNGANSSLQSDWQGFAAQAYHAAASGLAEVARGGAATFRECATAVSRYGTDLDDVQSALRRLRHLYDDALHRQAAAAGLAGRLQTTQAAATKKPEISKLGIQIGNAQHQAEEALNEANGYARHAQQLVNEFKGKAHGYAATLNGQRLGQPGLLGSPFNAPGTPGSGFGIPNPGGLFPGVNPDGLDPYRGIIPVGDPWHSSIPGYGIYMDATHGNATSPDDLTNLITLLAGGVAAGPLKDLGEDALKTIAEKLGIGASVGNTVLSKIGTSNTGDLVERLGSVLDKRVPGSDIAGQVAGTVYKSGGPRLVLAGLRKLLEDLAGVTGLKDSYRKAIYRELEKLASSRHPN